jgi:hypothetical protein
MFVIIFFGVPTGKNVRWLMFSQSELYVGRIPNSTVEKCYEWNFHVILSYTRSIPNEILLDVFNFFTWSRKNTNSIGMTSEIYAQEYIYVSECTLLLLLILSVKKGTKLRRERSSCTARWVGRSWCDISAYASHCAEIDLHNQSSTPPRCIPCGVKGKCQVLDILIRTINSFETANRIQMNREKPFVWLN